MVKAYPELAAWEVSFDGPYMAVKNLIGGRPKVINWRSITFLHGTSSKFADVIKKSGLQPRGVTGTEATYGSGVGAQAGRPDVVYLTTKGAIAMARIAAMEAARKFGGEPVIVYIRGLRETSMVPDEDSREITAGGSLERMGSVGHVGSIPPSKILSIKPI